MRRPNSQWPEDCRVFSGVSVASASYADLMRVP
jgi:hypothetical protein